MSADSSARLAVLRAAYAVGVSPRGSVETSLEELRSRLPEPKVVHGETLRPDLNIGIEDGEWEIEFCPLDPRRNVSFHHPSLDEAVRVVLEGDDAFLASQGGEGKDG